MTSVTEYLEQALHFDRVAAKEQNAALKVEYQRQADALRRLAVVEAKRLGIELPKPGDGSGGAR
jgi:hypothetical protein